MKISIYTSAFNLENNNFDIRDAIKNWGKYCDEIVIATMPSKDNSWEILESIESDFVKIVYTTLSIEDRLFDGALKNAALQKCSGDILWQMDLDERISGSVKLFKKVSRDLLNSSWDAFCIDVINLWGSMDVYKDFGVKWYCHKRGFFRGPVSWAVRADGTVDSSKSDGCELIDYYGNLVKAVSYRNFSNLESLTDYIDQKYPLIVHIGWVNAENKLKLNRWWKDRWEHLNGFDRGDIIMQKSDFENQQLFYHGINFNL